MLNSVRPELQDIVDEVSRLLGRPATLEDRDLNLVAFCSHGPEIDDIRRQTILGRRSTEHVRTWFAQYGIATTDQPVRTPASPDDGVLARLCLPVRWRGVTYGYLWLIDQEHDIDDTAVPTAMSLAERAGALMAQQSRTRAQLEFKLQDLVSDDEEAANSAADYVDDLGIIRRGVPVAAVELRLTRPAPAGAPPVNLWTLPRTVLTWTSDQHTTLLVPLPSGDTAPARDVAHRATELYAERLDETARAGLVTGIGAPRPDLAQARGSRREARLATKVVEAVPALRPVAAWGDLGVYRLIACGSERDLGPAVLDPAVRRLLDHDDPDLLRTAMSFLDHAGAVGQTAAALNVHRQTVYYRIRQVERVSGLDLSRGADRLMLHLGLTMAPLLPH